MARVPYFPMFKRSTTAYIFPSFLQEVTFFNMIYNESTASKRISNRLEDVSFIVD